MPPPPHIASGLETEDIIGPLYQELEETLLAKMVYIEQVMNICWPGLAKEVEDLCAKLKIEDVNTTSKHKIANAIKLKNACEHMEEED